MQRSLMSPGGTFRRCRPPRVTAAYDSKPGYNEFPCRRSSRNKQQLLVIKRLSFSKRSILRRSNMRFSGYGEYRTWAFAWQGGGW